MQMKQCPNGHFYDQSVHSVCPYCTPGAGDSFNRDIAGNPNNTIGVTMPVNNPASNDIGKTVSFNQQPADDDGHTVVVIQEEIGINPVVGWLVCVEGKEKGRDFRIHSENNFIGRSEKMDICVHGDETISRENHAIISFDSRECQYYYSPGSSKNISRVNDKPVFQTVNLTAYDKIEIGTTKMIFVPYCKEGFGWN